MIVKRVMRERKRNMRLGSPNTHGRKLVDESKCNLLVECMSDIITTVLSISFRMISILKGAMLVI